MTSWPLVGRAKELSLVTAAVSARRGAVISGPAGVGKTTLTLAVLEWVRQRGMSVAHTTATRASQGLPFGAFSVMLPSERTGEDLVREDLGDLLGRYVRALVEVGSGRPLLVFVDDAHHLDMGSATLVYQLALTRAATVLATVRAGEPTPDPIVALWKDGPAERIELTVLAEAVIEELLVTVLAGPVDASCVRQLVDHSEANPMFLRELVTGARETGALVEAAGLWRLRGGLEPTARLVELVALRLGDLTGPERSLLELLTLGEPLEEAELERLSDPDVVDAVENKGLITSRLDGRRLEVWLAHPVYGDVVRVGITARRERALARSRAQVVEASGSRCRKDTLRLASWHLVGGGGSAELFVAGAMAAHFQGRSDQAAQEAAALALDTTSDAERARVALLRFDNAFFLDGRANFRVLDDAADAITDPFWLDELSTQRLNVIALNSGPRAAVEAASPTLRRPRLGSLTAPHLVVLSLARLGRLDDAIQVVSTTAAGGAIPAAGEGWGQWTLFGDHAVSLVYAGRLGLAEELLTSAYDRVVDQPAAEARATVTLWLAVLHLQQGRVHTAFRRAAESYTLYQQLGRTLVARLGYIAAAQALAMAGLAEKAAQTLAALDALALPAVLLDQTDLLQARAWTKAAAGDLPAARAELAAAADLGEEVGDLIGATSALHSLASLGWGRQVAPRLAALADQVDGPLVKARVEFANGLAAHSNTVLAQASADFENLGAILYAAEASAAAAVILRRAGKAREAAAAEHRAWRLLARCEGAATPQVQMITGRALLTANELDAAMQAAAGRSNKQIAADMHVSVRTAETHLQRVYEKLGVSGRHELAEALRAEAAVRTRGS